MSVFGDVANRGWGRMKARPLWVRVVLGVLLAQVLVSFVLFIPLLLAQSIVSAFPILVCASFAGFLCLGGGNVLKTWGNRSRSDFERADAPGLGGYRFAVRPARATRLPLLVLSPLVPAGALLMASSGVSPSMACGLAFAIYVTMVGIFVLPGARHRRPVEIFVSPRGIEFDQTQLPIDRVADLSVAYEGIRLAEPVIPGPRGVPISTMIGRGMGMRQAARSYALKVRGDGESHGVIIVGGLTSECAENLTQDIARAVETFRLSRAA